MRPVLGSCLLGPSTRFSASEIRGLTRCLQGLGIKIFWFWGLWTQGLGGLRLFPQSFLVRSPPPHRIEGFPTIRQWYYLIKGYQKLGTPFLAVRFVRIVDVGVYIILGPTIPGNLHVGNIC